MEEAASDQDARPVGDKVKEHFYSSGDNEDEKAKEDWNRLTRARLKHILPTDRWKRNENYQNYKKKETHASEHLIELLNKVAESTNKALGRIGSGKGHSEDTHMKCRGLDVMETEMPPVLGHHGCTASTKVERIHVVWSAGRKETGTEELAGEQWGKGKTQCTYGN